MQTRYGKKPDVLKEALDRFEEFCKAPLIADSATSHFPGTASFMERSFLFFGGRLAVPPDTRHQNPPSSSGIKGL